LPLVLVLALVLLQVQLCHMMLPLLAAQVHWVQAAAAARASCPFFQAGQPWCSWAPAAALTGAALIRGKWRNC
jgi:hypothetical protein